MKRQRHENPDANDLLDVGWVWLFHMESILIVLHPYLTTKDLISLSSVNKIMNTTWINNERRLSVLCMRDRVFELTNRRYNVKNPLLHIKREVVKALVPRHIFKCWRCMKKRKHLADQTYFRLATCTRCAETYLRKHNVQGIDGVYNYLYRNCTDSVKPQFSIWFNNLRDKLEPRLLQYQFTFVYSSKWKKAYIPKKAIEIVVLQLQEETLNGGSL